MASYADEKKSTAAASASGSGCGNGKVEAPAAKREMTRLPEMEVLNILARDPRTTELCDVDSLRRLVQERGTMQVPEEVLRFVADSYSKEMREKVVAFQKWVYDQFEEKGYVEVPDQFITDRDYARKRKGSHIDQYLPDRYFTTIVDKDGMEKLVFSLTGKEKVVSESNSNEGSIFMTYSSKLVPEVKAACCKGVNSSHADGKKKPTAVATSVQDNGDNAHATREGMTRLPTREVMKILSRDPNSITPCNVEALSRLALEEQPGMLRMEAKSYSKQMREQFIAFQNWVLAEHEEKGYVEVPDEFMKETEDARKQQGEPIDLHLSVRHFKTVVDDDGSEKLVFSFKKEDNLVPESRSNQDNICLSFSAEIEPAINTTCHKMLMELGKDG